MFLRISVTNDTLTSLSPIFMMTSKVLMGALYIYGTSTSTVESFVYIYINKHRDWGRLQIYQSVHSEALNLQYMQSTFTGHQQKWIGNHGASTSTGGSSVSPGYLLCILVIPKVIWKYHSPIILFWFGDSDFVIWYYI